MSGSGSSRRSAGLSDIGDPSRFARASIEADPAHAAQTRSELGDWLRHHVALGALRLNDVVLAVYEAVANAVEFAYIGQSGAGAIEVSATREYGSLTVTVTDHGQWYWPTFDPKASIPHDSLRGRGIPLMKLLADEVNIHTTTAGTQVRLMWTGLPRTSAAEN
jgi:serine/threonine-protein kinase RsbW